MEIKPDEEFYNTRFRMRRLHLLISILIFAIYLYGCEFAASSPVFSPSTAGSELSAGITTERTPSVEPQSADRHLTLPSGLRVDEYVIQDAPKTEPLTFVPLEGSQQEILSRHEKERSLGYLDKSFFANGHFSMSADFGDQELIAREVITANENLPAQIRVDVILDDTVINTIPAGDISPLNPLQGLWSYDGHWVVEIATVTKMYDDEQDEYTFSVLGHIIKDGEDLNQRFGYQEMFGYQLLNEKPFYFFNQDGEIGISYDSQETHLGYETIPHYGCCSAAELNPKPAQNMVSFFARKDGDWRYIEIGVFE